jgi:hypothetical protein
MLVEETFVRQGKFAARFEVRQGDHPSGMCCGDRAEVSGQSAVEADEGDDLWYQWSSAFENGFPADGGWYTISQWHAKLDGVPPVQLASQGDGRWGLIVQVWDSPDQQSAVFKPWSTPVVTGQWTDIKLHIRWTASDDGFIELWVDGVPQTFTDAPCAGQTRCTVKTLRPQGGGVYFKQGLYRKDTIESPGVVYHDGFSFARSEAELQPL